MNSNDDATQRQIEAANPIQSTWLSANAGSGKTRVLTDRVARLLLGGTRPENILCLTYTKAAASEMQNRLFQRLGEWAMMPGNELGTALSALGGIGEITPQSLRTARTLFAAAIETPGGLKIQTIHSFCAGILRRFPLEAEVSPQFKEMEDRAAQLLREEVLDDLAQSNPDALAKFARHYSGAKVSEFLLAITGRKAAFMTPETETNLAQFFDIPETATKADTVNIAFIGGEIDLVDDLVEACKAATPSYQKTAAALKALNLSEPSFETLEEVFGLLLFSDKSSKSRNWPQSRHTSSVEALAHIIDDVHAWMDRTADAYDYVCKVDALEKTRALFAFAVPFVEAYEKKKAQRAALDFDDLITKAKALLEDPLVAQWVLFRLDGGVDHVLVDEAQDTSPDQWDIVRLLTQEFSTGEGARPDSERTVFVVGDKKQSIYSFQGADPEGFDRMRDHFDGELRKIQKRLYSRELLYSFRSSEAVLALVDQTFTGDMSDGIGDGVKHLAFKGDMPGRVDLWPAIEPSGKPEEREWDDPLDIKGPTNHQVILAEQIANEIKRMIKCETLPVKESGEAEWSRRRITAGDFLILVQGRQSGIFEHVIAACKAAKLDVAGADRLKLGAELAVKDISALLRFLALPEDDLSLAAALKSPLLGWSEKDLYDVAQPRPKGQTLWEALRKSNPDETTIGILNDLRRESDYLRPYDLINRLLVRHDGRRKLLSRLGQEAEDGIDALLSQALGYEQSAVPSLTGFLSWLQTEDITVKRQMDTAGDRIRVMTVHGAKGLEAPIVILPDTTKRKRALRADLLTSDGSVFWKPKSDVMPKSMRDIQESLLDAQDRERRRLLYVALTRAENWLIVAAAGDVGKDQESWHATLDGAMSHLDAVDHELPFGPIKRFYRQDWNAGPMYSQEQTPAALKPVLNFTSDLPTVPERFSTLSPSDLGGAKIMPGETHTDSSDVALAWGNIMHLLLEVLPDIDPSQRVNTATALAQSHSDAGLISDMSQLIDEAINLLNTRALSWVFENGLSEVPVSATLPSLEGSRIYGIIDRLIVSKSEVIAVDYKSNRLTPRSENETPIGLVRQMAAYRDALRLVYPSHRIRTVLLWTKSASITELTDAFLDTALADVTTP